MRLRADDLEGRVVIAADGQAIGRISAVLVDTAGWRVEAVHVELRTNIADRLGASRGMFHRGVIEVPVRFVQSVGDAVVLGANVDELREALPTTPAPPS
jgi:sporulation protein YlmC with PRC-barrel domain